LPREVSMKSTANRLPITLIYYAATSQGVLDHRILLASFLQELVINMTIRLLHCSHDIIADVNAQGTWVLLETRVMLLEHLLPL